MIIVSAGQVSSGQAVESTVNRTWRLENLSLIPGQVVQLLFRYRRLRSRSKNVIEKVRAISLEDGSVTEFMNEECRFGYRDSILK